MPRASLVEYTQLRWEEQIKWSAYTRVHNVVQRKIQTEKGTSAEIRYLRRLENLFC